jgi:hypothetical protein
VHVLISTVGIGFSILVIVVLCPGFELASWCPFVTRDAPQGGRSNLEIRTDPLILPGNSSAVKRSDSEWVVDSPNIADDFTESDASFDDFSSSTIRM